MFDKVLAGKNAIKISKDNCFEMISLMLCIFQFIFLCCANLLWSSHIIDCDMSDLYGHVREMWRTGSIMIKGWDYSTTLEIDSSALLALPIYGVTGNIFLSFAISNIIFIILWYFVIYRLVINCGGNNTAAFLAIDMVMIPYSIGMLEYFNMLFFNGGQYTIKVLIPLVFLCIISGGGRTHNTSSINEKYGLIMLVGLLAILQFVTSFSSGNYVLISGVFPMAMLGIVSWMNNHKLYSEKQVHIFILTLFIILLCSVTGIALARYYNAMIPVGSSTKITRSDEFILNFQTVIAGLFEILGCAPICSDVDVFSLTGLVYLLKAILTLGILFSVVYVQIRFIRRNEERYRNLFLLSSVLPWNFFIFVFSDTRYMRTNTNMEYRYYLMAFVPAIILTGIMLEKYIRYSSVSVASFVLLFIVVLTLGCDGKVPKFRENSDDVYELKESINNLPVDVGSVFFVGDDDTPRKMRLIDETRTYCVIYDDGTFGTTDNYLNYNSKFSQKNCILWLKNTTSAENLKRKVLSTYRKIETTKQFDIYYSDTNTLGK